MQDSQGRKSIDAEDIPDNKLDPVRRYLDEVAYGLKQFQKSKNVFGGLPFDAEDLKDQRNNLTGSGVPQTLRYLANNTDYVEKNDRKYRIELENIDKLLEEAEKFETIPTISEERDLIYKIVKEGQRSERLMYRSEIENDFNNIVDYEISDEVLENRIERHPDLETRKREDGRKIYYVD